MLTLYTRKDYLDNKITHDEYYFEIAKEIGIRPPDEMINKARKALNLGDEHLNTISLSVWDTWARNILVFNSSAVNDVFRKRGDYCTLAGLVCALKAITRYYAEHAT